MSITRSFFKIITGMLLTLSATNSHAQLVVSPHDTTVCGVPVTINATYPTGTSTVLSLSDDAFSALIPIGFTFNYYGTAYTQCAIGSNGVVTFNPTNAGGYCTWPINGAIPSGTLANTIMGPWMDIWPPGGGTISYVTTGVAPNRQFVVTWCDVPYFSCTQMKISTQIVLNETSDLVQVYISNRQTGCSWNGDYAIEGVNGPAGNGTAAPGRNFPTIWGANNDGYSFGWNGVTYIATPIAFAPLPVNPSVPINWYLGHPSNGNVIATNVASITVQPVVPTTYYAQIIACGDTSIDSSVITIGIGDSIEFMAPTNPSMCGAKDGSILLGNMTPGDPFILNYMLNGIPQPPVNVVVGPNGTINIPGLDTGTYTNIYITTPIGCESNRVGPAVLVNPPFSVGFDTVVTFGCETDQVQFLDQSVGVLTYAWDFGDGTTGSTASPLHIYQDQGVYNVTLIGTNGFCTDLQTMSVPLVHPLDAIFTVSEDSICNGETIAFTDNSIVSFNNTAYEWNFGDGGTSTDQNPTHQYTTDGIYNVTMTITDFLGCVDVANIQTVVASLAIEIGPKDTSVCLVDSMLLYSQSFYPPYFSDGITYSWSPDDNIGSPNSEETYYYNEVPGDYYYVLTATGYPMECVAKDTLHIHIQPRPVLVNVTPNTVIKYGEDIQLSASGVQYYIWTPPATLDNPNISTPIGSPRESVVYSVYGMNEHGGCRDTAQVEVTVDYTMEEFIPSVFSPNGDGKNDLFRIVNLRYQKLVEFRVFNRWGKEVYNYTDGSKGWDGTYNGAPQDPGVYTYIIRVNVPDGDARVYKGNITLIR